MLVCTVRLPDSKWLLQTIPRLADLIDGREKFIAVFFTTWCLSFKLLGCHTLH